MKIVYGLGAFGVIVLVLFLLNKKFHFVKIGVRTGTGACPRSRNFVSKDSSEGTNYL